MKTRSGPKAYTPRRFAVTFPDAVHARWSFYWRVFGTGVAFGVFGIGALAFGLVLVPVCHLLPGTRRARETRVQWLVYLTFRMFVWFVESLRLIRVSRIGMERLRRGGPHLVIANHPTLVDAVLLISCMPQADCVTKKAVWGNAFLRQVVRGVGYIPNDQRGSMVEACAKRLQDGRSLLLFPEGTRSPRGELGRFRRGAARIALMSGYEVLPVVITCDPPTLAKGEKWYEVPGRRIDFTLRVEEPIASKDYIDNQTSSALAARRLTTIFRAVYQRGLTHGSV